MRKTNRFGIWAGLVAASALCAAAPSWAAPAHHAKANASAAHERPATTMNRIVRHYLEIQKALAGDQLAKAKAPALAIAKLGAHAGTQGAEAARSAAKLAKATSLKDARAIFQSLSKPVVAWVSKTKPAELEVYYCPMVKAKWVQAKGETSNPFLGKEMLSCGVKD